MATAEQLITENLDIWASAVQTKSTAGRGTANKLELYGIKKLRELILELAIRGLLVPQDPNDEPSSELLEKIAAEKAQLVFDGKLKKQKSSAEIGEDEKPFHIPAGWEWSRLRDVGRDWGQKQPKQKFTYIDVGSIDKEAGLINEPTVLSEKDAPSRARKIVKKGTVIYSTVRPYLLNIAVIDREFEPEPIASTAFAIIHPFAGIEPFFVYRYLRSPTFVEYVESVQTGIAYPAVNDRQFFSGLIPVPPTSEQTRIVAKVDELMALCDQLEQQQEASITAHQTLVQTLLDALTTATERDGFTAAWARITDHFDTLFTTEWSIDQLKQTILQLAVMGKLVPQDPNDESASESLKKIAAEKERLVKEGKIKKQKALPAIEADEMPFSLPKGWCYTRLDDLCAWITSGSTPPKSEFRDDAGVPYLKVYNIREQAIDFDYKPQFINKACHEGKLKRSILYPGDVVMNIVGPPLGKIAIIPDTFPEWNCNQAIAFFRPIDIRLNIYIYTYLKSHLFLDYIELIGTAGQDNISVTKSRTIVLPMPPLEEQRRIVAKVDELMALCKTLKAGINTAQTMKLNLATTLAGNAAV